jgi:nitroreductase/NAD-dependent dihydropyrimidine dehydrogenase PreA subunit
MAIPTSRTNAAAVITIDEELCSGCGKCVEVCKDFEIEIRDGIARHSGKQIFGCMACGHCMAICPEDAIRIEGRDLSPDDLFPLPSPERTATYETLVNLMNRRRSIREFTGRPVEQEIIKKVLDAARTAPMGIPPSDVHIMVLDTREKVRAFAKDYARYLEKMKWFFSGWFLGLMRFVWGKDTDQFFRNFMRPLVDKYIGFMNQGEDFISYDAPVSIYFYGSPFCDPADPTIAATYAMLAAESLGLGTCMLGAIHPFIQTGKAARKFREKHGIRYKSTGGLFLIMGYPSVEYRKGIRRSFAWVN